MVTLDVVPAYMTATYKSRFTDRPVVLVNPSLKHLKRIYTAGHDVEVKYYDNTGTLIKKKLIKY